MIATITRISDRLVERVVPKTDASATAAACTWRYLCCTMGGQVVYGRRLYDLVHGTNCGPCYVVSSWC
ncbi:hypothetical protein [Nonomuraea candida]|uniref:hypothetical protein n=1 Tax=Nonomuraea candida TaxID=359159 RepID=UPI0005BB7503|nr:hypothetical protein [Nonomuraea candida]